MSDDLYTLKTKHGVLYRHNGTDICMEDDGIWVSMRPLDAEGLILVDKDEWPAFVEMIKAIDAKRQEIGDGTAYPDDSTRHALPA